MLFLHFEIGDDAFALSAERIVEIVPLVGLRSMRHAPAAVIGSFEYRGRFIAVVDACLLELGRPAHRRLSTRIAVVRHPNHEATLFALVVEHATEMLDLAPEVFAPFAPGPRGLIQRLELEDLLSAELLAYLAGEAVQA